MQGVVIKWHNAWDTLVVVRGCWLLDKEISKRKFLLWGHPLVVGNMIVWSAVGFNQYIL